MELQYSAVSDPRLGDLEGTADQLFVYARNGYVEDVDSLEAIRDILSSPAEGKTDKAMRVGFMAERERNELNPDVDTSVYNIGQLKLDFSDNIGGVDGEEIADGLYLTLFPDRGNAVLSLQYFQGDEEGTGAVSIPLEEFFKMTQEDLNVRIGELFSQGMEWKEE